jgi:D-serine deaminase-like pyridoxal phosphate-dependent protein
MHKEMLAKASESSPDTPVLSIPCARPGDDTEHIPTPALLLDLDSFEENLRAMQVLAESRGVALRAHAKAHKCPEIALRQVALGAVGICCQKVSEAIPFVQAGIHDILVSNEVVGAARLDLLAQLALRARISVCADNPLALQALSQAMVARGAQAGVLVELDVGQKRCGVQTLDELVALAEQAQALPNITFLGIQAYHGTLQHKKSIDQRHRACEKVAAQVHQAVKALLEMGHDCRVISGGGTGSAQFDAAGGTFTEIQAGSYAFMDADYGAIEWGETALFRHSLFLLGTVISTPTPDRVVLDVGLKSTSAESGLPRVADLPGVVCTGISDEHTVLQVSPGATAPALGQAVRLVPSHCDPTFNLHDHVVALRKGRVEAVWAIAARGLSF